MATRIGVRSRGRRSIVDEYMAGVRARRAASTAGYRKRRLLLRQPGGEFKSRDTEWNPNINLATSVQLINGIARGDEINERTGREISIRSIEMKYKIKSTDTTGIAQPVRVLLVYDKQPNAAALTAAQVLVSTGGDFGTITQRNLENRKRFWILMDRNYVVGPQGSTTTALGCSPWIIDKFYRRITLPVVFNSGDAGTIADITTGSLYVIIISDVADGATDCSGAFSCRVRYQDK